MATKKAAGFSPIGRDAANAAAHRRATDPKYAALEKKYEAAMAIADLVILHRMRKGLTQKALAERMGIKVPDVSRLESGLHNPTASTLNKLAHALGGHMKFEIEYSRSDVGDEVALPQ